jgi:Cutinase
VTPSGCPGIPGSVVFGNEFGVFAARKIDHRYIPLAWSSSPGREREKGEEMGMSEHRGKRVRGRVSALIPLLLLSWGAAAIGFSAPASAAGDATYTAAQTIPVPPASNYAGSGGGDGWGIALNSTSVFNVFHHASDFTVACHLQSDASPCWNPRTITDDTGGGFAVSGHPGMWLDRTSNDLYVYATRVADGVGGVVCVDTVAAALPPNPFCGFTALTAAGDSPTNGGISDISEPVLSGGKWYAFNYVQSEPAGSAKNALMCFDTTTLAACASQPFAVGLGSGTLDNGSFPEPQVATIGGRILVAASMSGAQRIGCFAAASASACAGTWPVDLDYAYASWYGAPFPMLDPAGSPTGFCLPTGTDQCFTFDGASAPTPAGLGSVVGGTTPWNGNAVAIGPRVYVPNGNANQVECFSWATGSGCPNFPKSFDNLGYLYTVNPDPARPTCLWVNADNGGSQIQNFDAYTGGACGQGPIRVLASSFVVATDLCKPAAYTSLQVTEPPRSGYDSGSIAFQDADAQQIPNVNDATLDGTGTATLTGTNLSTVLGLPQFLITLVGPHQPVGQVGVTLTWTGTDDPSCVKPGTIVTPGGGGGGSGEQCGDLVFLAAPGSGEHFKTAANLSVSPELKSVYRRMASAAHGKKIGVRVINYSAPHVAQLTAGLAKIKAGSRDDFRAKAKARLASNLTRYLTGKDAGVTAMRAEYASVRAECPAATKIVVGGYSQGAAVAHEFLNQLAAGNDAAGQDAILAAALIADPERTQPSAVHEMADAPSTSSGVCGVLADVVSCAGADPVADVAAPFTTRSHSVCAANDVVCDTSSVLSAMADRWADVKGRSAVLGNALKVHGSYPALPATRATGTEIGSTA